MIDGKVVSGKEWTKRKRWARRLVYGVRRLGS